LHVWVFWVFVFIVNMLLAVGAFSGRSPGTWPVPAECDKTLFGLPRRRVNTFGWVRRRIPRRQRWREEGER